MGEIKSLPLHRRPSGVALAFFLFVLAPGTPLLADGDPYLDALKAEAMSGAPEGEGLDDNGRPPERTDDQPQMEEWLETNYIGTYTFYKRLSEPKRNAVYRLYRSGAEITKLRDKINELLRQ